MPENKKLGFLERRNFLDEYAKYAKATGNHPDPYAIEHYYDYEKLFKDTGSIMNAMSKDGHLPSEYKTWGHPDLFIKGKNTQTQFANGGKMYPEGGFVGEDDKLKPRYLSPEQLGAKQVMEADTTSTSIPDYARIKMAKPKPELVNKNPENPYKEINSTKADIIRSLLPVPKNVGQLISKEVFKDSRMSNESLSDDEKIVIWNSIQNAKKRTGKDNGGTEYSDYGTEGSDFNSSEKYNDWFNRGKIGLLEGAYNSISNPGFRIASTVGRGRYWTDPDNPNIIQYTDVYDWNTSEKNYKGKNAYQQIRNEVRNREEKNLDPVKNDPYRMNFSFDKDEMEQLIKDRERKKEIDYRVSDTPFFAKGGKIKPPIYVSDKNMYATGGPFKKEDVFTSPLNEGQTMFKPETQWYQSWINDPEYAARMENNFKPDGAGNFMEGIGLEDVAENYNMLENRKGIQDLINTTTGKLDNIPTLYNSNPNINNSLIDKYKASYRKDPKAIKLINKNLNKKNQGWTDSEGRIVITPTANDMYGPSSVKVHEDTHATGLDAVFKGKFKRTLSQDPEVQKNFRRKEQYPYLMQMRYDQGFKPGEEISPERLKQIRESGYQNHLFQNYTDEEISNYLNTLASNQTQTPMQYAAHGGKIQYEEGGEIEEGEKGYKVPKDPETGMPVVNLREFEVVAEAPDWLKSHRKHPFLDNNPGLEYVPIESALLAPVAGSIAARAVPTVASALELPAVIGGRTMPLLTAGNTLGVAGGLQGANMLGSDIDSGYYASNAPLDEKIARGLETGFLMGTSPGILSGTGSAYKTAKNSLGKNKKLLPNEPTSNFGQQPSNMDLEELRRVYHNLERDLQYEEARFLHNNGFGLREDYVTNPVSNQLPPPPSEIQFMPDGTTRNVYNQQQIVPTPEGGLFRMTPEQTEAAWRNIQNNSNWQQTSGTGNLNPNSIDLRRPAISNTNYDLDLLQQDYINMIQGNPPVNYPNLTRQANQIAQQPLLQQRQAQQVQQVQQTQQASKPQIRNKSGLTKEEVVEKASVKDKDVISKMSETEFENTVLKPNGEVVPYQAGKKAEGVIAATEKEYIDEFNRYLDDLNENIINDPENGLNTSGIRYEVKGINEHGVITIHTPKQTLPDGTVIEAGDQTVKMPIRKAGFWRGEIEDIASHDYINSIPGLKAYNTSGGIFPRSSGLSGTPGTGFYKSLNKYMKKYDLGRVSDGASGQSKTKIDPSTGKIKTGSYEVWEGNIKKDKAVGFYSNSDQVTGIFRSLFPYIGVGYLGYQGLKQKPEQQSQGGQIMTKKKYNTGGAIDGVINAAGAIPVVGGKIQAVATAANLQGQAMGAAQNVLGNMAGYDKQEQAAAFKSSNWAKENLGSVLGGLAAPILTGIDAFGAKDRVEDYRGEVTKNNQLFNQNNMAYRDQKGLMFEKGGQINQPMNNIDTQPLITDYQGPKHEEGGIPIGRNNEVQGGEVSMKDGENGNIILGNVPIFEDGTTAEKYGQKILADLKMRPWEKKQALVKFKEAYALQEAKKAEMQKIQQMQEMQMQQLANLDMNNIMKEDMGPEVFKAAQGGKIKYGPGGQLDWLNSIANMGQNAITMAEKAAWAPNQGKPFKQNTQDPQDPQDPYNAMASGLKSMSAPTSTGNSTSTQIPVGGDMTMDQLEQFIGLDKDLNAMGQFGQMVAPLTDIGYGLMNKTADNFKYDRVKAPELDQFTMPNAVRTQMNLSGQAGRTALQRNAQTQQQLMSNIAPFETNLGIAGANEINKTRSALQNQQAGLDWQAAQSNQQTSMREKDQKTTLQRQNDDIALRGVDALGNRGAAAIADKNKYKMDLLNNLVKLNNGNTEDFSNLFEVGPDGKTIVLKRVRNINT